MKPSERVQEIYNSKTRISTGDNDTRIQTESWLESILDYLDEQWEQQKPCEEVVCEKCGLSGQIDGYGLCWSSRCTDTRETL